MKNNAIIGIIWHFDIAIGMTALEHVSVFSYPSGQYSAKQDCAVTYGYWLRWASSFTRQAGVRVCQAPGAPRGIVVHKSRVQRRPHARGMLRLAIRLGHDVPGSWSKGLQLASIQARGERLRGSAHHGRFCDAVAPGAALERSRKRWEGSFTTRGRWSRSEP